MRLQIHKEPYVTRPSQLPKYPSQSIHTRTLSSDLRLLLAVGLQVRALLGLPATYLILLLEPGCSIEQVKEGLRCGADDFVFQAWNSAELIMRVGIAERILNLKLANRETLPAPMTPPKFQKWKMSTASLRV